MKDSEKATFVMRLQSMDIGGLDMPPIQAQYMINYANNLIGRQLKILMQLCVFVVYDLVPPLLYEIWKAIGSLGALLWVPEIDDMDIYCVGHLFTLSYKTSNDLYIYTG